MPRLATTPGASTGRQTGRQTHLAPEPYGAKKRSHAMHRRPPNSWPLLVATPSQAGARQGEYPALSPAHAPQRVAVGALPPSHGRALRCAAAATGGKASNRWPRRPCCQSGTTARPPPAVRATASRVHGRERMDRGADDSPRSRAHHRWLTLFHGLGQEDRLVLRAVVLLR